MSTWNWKKENWAEGMKEARNTSAKKNYKYIYKYPQPSRAIIEKNKKERWKSFIEDLKSVGCSKCSEKDPDCIQFHHRDPSEKLFTLELDKIRRTAKEKVLEEISKCDLLCANCHIKHHAKIRRDIKNF